MWNFVILDNGGDIMVEEKLYTIGEISKICNIKSSKLRYYDEIGLIRPYFVDEQTGYRYYSTNTILEIPILYYYQMLGFSLKEIRLMLERGDLDCLQQSFNSKISEYDDLLQKLYLKRNSIASWLELILETKQVMSMESVPITVKFLPEQTLCSVRPSDFPERTYDNLLINTTICSCMPRDDIYTLGALYLYYPDGNRMKWEDIQLGIVNQVYKDLSLETWEIGGYAAVTTYHCGDFAGIDETVGRMKQWAAEHRFQLRGDLLERSVIDCWSTKDPNWWLMEIFLPII